MAEYYVTGFQDYIETLCINHKQVLHSTATGGQRAFVRFQSDDDVNQVLNNQGANIVCIKRFFGKSVGDSDDEQMRQYIIVRFASVAKMPADGTMTTSISNALDTAFTIMMDFIARMRMDMDDDDCGPLRGLELNNCSWDEIEEMPWLENHFGWDLTLPLKSNMPAYQASRWNA